MSTTFDRVAQACIVVLLAVLVVLCTQMLRENREPERIDIQIVPSQQVYEPPPPLGA